ncbi:site-specific integrase [Polaribacter sp. MSW13]|uniref:Site-specific integrase n=1 Tax=Polaribacter marinus TaxID=2916838 RepID=A0A9X1VM14_9FLAO|nr:tyrosine-type recombinase/integrase [Polaribacter marinus]MCI2228984.1 site-specific integrase [Polaribacter marinus]
MASINFLYRSTKEKSNLNLRLLYRHNTKDYVFGAKTKIEVSKNYWSKQHKKKSKDIEITNLQTEINNELNKIENHVFKAFNSVNPESINKEWLTSQIDYYYNPPTEKKEIPKDLINYIDFYIDYRKNETTKSTLKKIKVVKQLLIRFEAYRKSTILIKDINDNFKNEFVNYCKSELYAQNTIQRAFVFIKTFCKHAKFSGIETHHQLDGLKVERQKVDKIYLTFEDLTKIENINKDKLTDSLENAKDWLIISCYTGQRISDFMRFTKDLIRIENGKHLIEFTQQKTGKNMTVPLHSKVLEILNKRNGNFPYKISDQKYNDFIKDVCKLAEINEPTKGSKMIETEKGSKVFRKQSGTYKKWELVTSHIGRRSFATNFYSTIPTSLLINITGHSTEAMFLNYIGKSNKDLALEITKYF